MLKILFHTFCMSQRFRVISVWLLLLGAVIMTIGPAEVRISTGLPLKLERFLAIGLVTCAFVVAYPRRSLWVGASAVGLVLAMEALQGIVPGRHGTLLDAAVKMLGACGGTATGWGFNSAREWLRHRSAAVAVSTVNKEPQ